MLSRAFIPVSTRAMLLAMKHALLLSLGLVTILVAGSAVAGPAVEEGPLAPCSQPQGRASADSSGQPAQASRVEIATSFSKLEALAEFDRD